MQKKLLASRFAKFKEVSLRYLAELRDEALLVRLNKEMSYSRATSAAFNVGRGEASLEHLRCQKNRPINVLTSDDQTVRLYLKKVRNWYNYTRYL